MVRHNQLNENLGKKKLKKNKYKTKKQKKNIFYLNKKNKKKTFFLQLYLLIGVTVRTHHIHLGGLPVPVVASIFSLAAGSALTSNFLVLEQVVVHR